MTVSSTQNGDARFPEGLRENRWRGMRKHSKREGSRVALQTRAKLDCECNDPIGVLKDCHRKIKRSLHVLWVIADRAAGRELAAEETAVARSAIDCVRVNGTLHTADEEQSLFPRLRAQTITGDSEELGLLEDNRCQADPLHALVETLYSTWISAGALRPENQLRLQSCTETLKRLFEQHIEIEEHIVFPRALQLLDGRTIAAIGEEFRARRS